MVRQTADVLRRFGALEQADLRQGADARPRHEAAGHGRQLVSRAPRSVSSRSPGCRSRCPPDDLGDDTALGQVIALAMRPFLSRCAEVLQQRPELANWTHAHCALCGGEPDLAVITPSAERHLICGRCSLRWKFEPLTCPVLPQQRPLADHVVCDDRRQVSRLRVRRLPAVSEGVRRPPRDAAGDADGGQRRHTAARRGGDAARIYVVTVRRATGDACVAPTVLIRGGGLQFRRLQPARRPADPEPSSRTS